MPRGLTPQPVTAELPPAKRASLSFKASRWSVFHEERAQLCVASDQRIVVHTDEVGLSAARELIVEGADDLVAMSPADFDHWLETSPDDDLKPPCQRALLKKMRQIKSLW